MPVKAEFTVARTSDRKGVKVDMSISDLDTPVTVTAPGTAG
ncbi:MAG TPA: hypothetical protein VFX16_30800 [Pseudonocardiaceae bacterium]|nr:hypothetical protein [Pseudonocardiaceae bacterium]